MELRPHPDEEHYRAAQAISVLSVGLIAVSAYSFVQEWVHG